MLCRKSTMSEVSSSADFFGASSAGVVGLSSVGVAKAAAGAADVDATDCVGELALGVAPSGPWAAPTGAATSDKQAATPPIHATRPIRPSPLYLGTPLQL